MVIATSLSARSTASWRKREVRSPTLSARVSSHPQKDDREHPKERLPRSFPGAEVHTDLRSGPRFDRPGSHAVLQAIRERFEYRFNRRVAG